MIYYHAQSDSENIRATDIMKRGGAYNEISQVDLF
jgi:hypothetical protein